MNPVAESNLIHNIETQLIHCELHIRQALQMVGYLNQDTNNRSDIAADVQESLHCIESAKEFLAEIKRPPSCA